MITVQEVAAQRVRRTADRLVELAKQTTPGKVGWSPSEGGRSVLDHLINACAANRSWARLLDGRASGRLSDQEYRELVDSAASLDEACELISTTASELESAIRATSDTRMEQGFRAPWWKDEETLPVAVAFTEAEGNMSFCSGQVYELQVMAGCRESAPSFRG